MQGFCAGIVRGMVVAAKYSDAGGLAFSGEGAMTSLDRQRRCLDVPKNVTLDQGVRVVVR
jgi:hypothetical protein